MQTGDRLTAGDIYGEVQENSLMLHRIMVPANARGNVTFIAPEGEYSLEDKVLELEFNGTKKASLYYKLPVWLAACSNAGLQHLTQPPAPARNAWSLWQDCMPRGPVLSWGLPAV